MGKAKVVKKPSAPAAKASKLLFQRTTKTSVAAITTTRNTNNSLAAASSAIAISSLPRKNVTKPVTKGKAASSQRKVPAKATTSAKGVSSRLSRSSSTTSAGSRVTSNKGTTSTKAAPPSTRRNTQSEDSKKPEKKGRDSKDTPKSKDNKDPPKSKDSKDPPKGKESKDPPKGKDSKDLPKGKGSKDPSKGKDGKDPIKGKDSKDPPKGKESKDQPKGKESKDPPKGKDSKDPPKGKESKDTPKGKEIKDPPKGKSTPVTKSKAEKIEDKSKDDKTKKKVPQGKAAESSSSNSAAEKVASPSKPAARRASSVSITSRKNSTTSVQATGPPKTRQRKESVERPASPRKDKDSSSSEKSKSKSPSPKPRTRNQSSSSAVGNDGYRIITTRKRSHSSSMSVGSSSSSPLSPSSSSSSSYSSGTFTSRKKLRSKPVKKVIVTKKAVKKVEKKVDKKVEKKADKTKSKNVKDSGKNKTMAKIKPKKVIASKIAKSSAVMSRRKKPDLYRKPAAKTIKREDRHSSSASTTSGSSTRSRSSAKDHSRVAAKKIAKKAIKTKAKPKPKLKLRPKSKKRMASLNAKAILEASYETPEKKIKVSGASKVGSVKGSASPQYPSASTAEQQPKTIEIKDLHNLLEDVKIEIRSGPPPQHQTTTSSDKQPHKIERKRKSGASIETQTQTLPAHCTPAPPTASAEASPAKSSRTHMEEKTSSSSSKDKSKYGHGSSKSKSPVPKKKAKVTTAECSTSTPAWNWDPCLPAFVPQAGVPMAYEISDNQVRSQDSNLVKAAAVYEQRPQAECHYYGNSHVGLDPHGAFKHSGSNASLSTTGSLPHYGGTTTVYQPAGPLIEPHKTPSTGERSEIHLPETVRLPPDLKVTYQAHPPANAPLLSSSALSSSQSKQTSQSSGTSQHHHSKSSKGSSQAKSTHSQGTSSASKLSSQNVLHQPYKSSSSASSSTTSNSGSSARTSQFQPPPQPLPQPSPSQAVSSNLIPYASSAASSSLGCSLNQQHAASSNVTLAAHHPLSTSAPGMYYPGFLGPHHSPFAPSKYPMVPPDSFRSHSPYPTSFLYAPSTPQANPQNYYMTPFYTPPMTPTSTAVVGSSGATRPLMPSHHSSSAFYQSNPGGVPPPSTHHPSNYYLQAPSAHHSIPSQSSPGHAGLFHPNQSSHPACPCPMDSCHHRNTKCSSTTSITNSSKPSQPLPPPQQPCATHGFRLDPDSTPNQQPSAQSCAPVTANVPRRKNVCQPPAPATPAVAADPPKAIQNLSMGSAQAKQLESAKTFTEQYSLPDDITITPILVVGSTVPGGQQTTASGVTTSGSTAAGGVKCSQKPKDIVHVINPRSGTTTTIAKHISNSTLSVGGGNINSPSKNVSPVKPNNAGSVGKIHPDLDVIVLPPGQRHPREIIAQVKQLQSKISYSGSDNTVSNSSIVANSIGNQRTNGLADKYNKSTIVEGDPKLSSVVPLINGTDALHAASAVRRSRRKSGSPTAARALPREEVFEMRNSTIVNEKEAVAAASALVVPPNGSYIHLSPHKNGLRKSGLKNMNSDHMHSKFRDSNIKVTTRSTTANAKIKTRSSVKDLPCYVTTSKHSPGLRTEGPDGRNHNRILKRRVKLRPMSDRKSTTSLLGHARRSLQQHQSYSRDKNLSLSSPGSATSSGSSSSHVILRIPSVSRHHDRLGQCSSSASTSHQLYRTSMAHARRNVNSHGESSRLHDFGHLDDYVMLDRSVVVGESSGKYRAQIAGSMAFNALKKRAIVKPLSPNVMNGALQHMLMARRQPKWSNGWRFEGEPFQAKVYLTNDDQPVMRRCYPAMRHDGGDVIQARDCVLLKSGPRKTDLPFVAKVAALWENPVDGEMMFSLLWYYRPEHTEIGRTHEDMPDEIFASKHRDCNSVATIEDRCYVLTLNEYCRYKKRLKQLEEGIIANLPLVPLSTNSGASTSSATDIALAVWYGIQGDQRRVPAAGKVSPEVVFFCRKVYDFRQKRMLKNPT